MSTTNQSAAAGTEIANYATIPSDGDPATAASVDVPFEIQADDVKRLRTRFAFDELSFNEPGDGQGLRGGSGNTAGEHTFAAWALDRRLLHAYNDDAIKRSLDGGYSWANEATGFSVIAGLAGQSDSNAAVNVNGGAGFFSATGPGNAWASTGITGTTPVVPSCIVADPFRASTYWVGGTDNALPKVWSMVSVNGAVPTQVQYALVGGVAGAQIVAPGRTYVLASSNDGGTSHLWQITPGGAVVSVTPPSATYIVDIQWLDSFGWFLLIASDGSGTLEFWTSPTGATGSWSIPPTSGFLVSLTANAFISHSAIRGSCVLGPLSYGGSAPSPFVPGALPCVVVLPISLVSTSTVPRLLLSADGGLTWSLMSDPLMRHVSLSPNNKTTRTRVVNNRVMAYGYNAAGNVAHALGLRGGKPV